MISTAAASVGKAEVKGLLDRLDDQVVEHLQRGGDDPLREIISLTVLGRVVDGVEDAEQRPVGSGAPASGGRSPW